MSKPYVIFVGSNPSQACLYKTAFHINTRSRTILKDWIGHWDTNIQYINIVDSSTSNNRPLLISEIRFALPGLKDKIGEYENSKIVTLGKAADKAVSMLGLEHFAAPHPSGRNRLLNNKEYVSNMITDLRNYISEQ